jgi:hypothetical protein
MPLPGIYASSFNASLPAFQGDYWALNAVTLTSTASSITFTGIPQNYTHLQIRGIGKDNRASANPSVLYMQLNGDSNSNYSQHYLVGDGSAAYSGGGSYTQIAVGDMVTGAASNAANYGAGVIDVLDYANVSKFKTVRSIGGMDFNGSGTVGLYSGNWRNTTSITSLTLFSFSGTFVAGTSYALYGVK